jgi:hypothetical protein
MSEFAVSPWVYSISVFTDVLMMRKANPKRSPLLPRPRMSRRQTKRRPREREKVRAKARARTRMEMGMNTRRAMKEEEGEEADEPEEEGEDEERLLRAVSAGGARHIQYHRSPWQHLNCA